MNRKQLYSKFDHSDLYEFKFRLAIWTIVGIFAIAMVKAYFDFDTYHTKVLYNRVETYIIKEIYPSKLILENEKNHKNIEVSIASDSSSDYEFVKEIQIREVLLSKCDNYNICKSELKYKIEKK